MIYFDHAATSYPKPPAVFKTIEQTLRERGGNPGRSGHRLSLAAAEKIYETRETLARFFDSPTPESFVFTSNATHALNLALKSAVLPGDHVLISDLEHNAVFRPVYRRAAEPEKVVPLEEKVHVLEAHQLGVILPVIQQVAHQLPFFKITAGNKA